MTSTKSPPPTAAHSLTSVIFNGKELVRYDYDGYGPHGNLLWYSEYTPPGVI